MASRMFQKARENIVVKKETKSRNREVDAGKQNRKSRQSIETRLNAVFSELTDEILETLESYYDKKKND